jgi:hypothetical protein
VITMNKAPLYLLIVVKILGPVLTAPVSLPSSSAATFTGVPSAQIDMPQPTDGRSLDSRFALTILVVYDK